MIPTTDTEMFRAILFIAKTFDIATQQVVHPVADLIYILEVTLC
jgi:hypothetical protein